jgi:hypothetical protein
MSKKILISSLVPFLMIAASQAAGGMGPCEQIKQACLNSGFVDKEAKIGKGLWMDCVNPIMQSTTAKKSQLVLPNVDSAVVAACKAKHPKFGEGKVGN